MLTTMICAAMFAPAAAPAYEVNSAGALLGQEVLAFAFAPSGYRFVAGMADRSVKIFDAKTRKTMRVFTGHKFPCRAVAWSPKGTRIASGAENAEIRVWDLKTGNHFSLRGHQRAIQALWFSRDGKKLISTADDDVIRVWDLNKKKSVLMIKGAGVNVYGARFDRSGRRIIAASLGKGMIVYNASTGKAAKSYGEHRGVGVNDVDVNSGYTRAVTAGRDGNVGVWNLSNGKRISYLRGHKDWVVRVALSPNGKLLASSSSDGTVRVWDMSTLQEVKTIPNKTGIGSPLAWNAGSSFLATVGADNYTRLYTVTK